MSKKFNLTSGIVSILCVIFIGSSFINNAIAANISSIDFESSSSQDACITDEDQTNLDLVNNFTVSAWIQLESQPSLDDVFHILAKQDGNTPDRAYQIYYSDFSGTKRLGMAVSADGDSQKNFDVARTLTTGAWQHVVFVYTAGVRMEIFLNGISVGSDTSNIPVALHNSANTFCIGSLVQNESFHQLFWDGKIDDVRVWNRELSNGEISDLYTNSESFSNGSNLQGWWKFDNDYTDASGNGNDLTPTNNPTFSSDVPITTPPPPPPAEEVLSAYKDVNESVTSSGTLQSDDHLQLSLGANKTYAVEGVIFLSSTKAKPDAKISFNATPDSTMMLGYLTNKDGGVLTDSSVSSRIVLPANNPVPVFIKGSIKTGSDPSDLELLWAQATSNSAPTTVLKGSYLRAEEI